MWRILCQSEMRSDLVVVAGIGLQDPAQVGFTQDHDVIQAFLRIEPISLSARPFCQGACGAIG